MQKRLRVAVVAVSAVAILLGIGAVALPQTRVRLEVVGLTLAGRLPSLTTRDLGPLLRPHAGFDVDMLAESRNPYAALRLPTRLLADSAAGRALYQARCAQCHGVHAEGAVGPSLALESRRHGATDWATFRVIQDGVSGTAMRPAGLSFTDTWRVIAGLRAFQGGAAHGDQTHPALSEVSGADIAAADASDREWLAYSGGWSGRRNKEIPELTATSIQRLRLAWAFQLPPGPLVSQSTPLAVRGLVVVTAAQDVVALKQEDGSVAWRFHRELATDVKLCCTRSNRGAAVLGSLLFVGTLDAHLLALDLSTGRVVWDTQVADATEGYSITGAPLVVDGRVLIGIGGGEFGVRGFLDAYDAASGRRLWRFYTIPARGEPGRESWPSEGTPPGGGPTWVPGAYDPERHLLYWGTGNPAPDFAADVRNGDNLFTNSVIALDIRSGTLRWSYQFTPHDSHDWDSAQSPVLVDAAWNGRQRPLLLWANRNGFFYVLDRETGEFLRATPYAKQTWNDGFDATGRPITRPTAFPTPEGAIVYPGVGGATNWWPPTYSDRLGLLFVAIRDNGSVYFRDRKLTAPNGQFVGGRTEPVPDEETSLSIIALDATTGAIRWQTPAPETLTAAMGGLLSISDRLVLGGQSNTFFALDAGTGRRIWQTSLGAMIEGAPIAFRAGQTPYIAITAGAVLFVFKLPPT